MGEVTGIQWCHHTLNWWIGCEKVANSGACDNCYAESGSRRLGAQHGLKLWDGDRYMTGAAYRKQPFKWNRAAEKAGERRRVFCMSYADVFEDNVRLIPERVELCKVIEQTPWLDYLLLTKRPKNIVNMVPPAWLESPLRNVWYGTTCEDQAHADERITHLLQVPAAVRFISIEPQLGPINIGLLGTVPKSWGLGYRPVHDLLHWAIVGGESGNKARPFDPEWARSIVRECREAGVAPFVKQMGRRVLGDDTGFTVNRWILDDDSEWVPPIIGERAHQRPDNAKGFVLFDSHGGDMTEWPADLRIRDFPRTA